MATTKFNPGAFARIMVSHLARPCDLVPQIIENLNVFLRKTIRSLTNVEIVEK